MASDWHFKCAYTLARSEFEFRIAPASALCALMQRESASVERVSVSESVRVRVRGEEVVEYEVSGCNEMTQISGCNPLQQAFNKPLTRERHYSQCAPSVQRATSKSEGESRASALRAWYSVKETQNVRETKSSLSPPLQSHSWLVCTHCTALAAPVCAHTTLHCTSCTWNSSLGSHSSLLFGRLAQCAHNELHKVFLCSFAVSPLPTVSLFASVRICVWIKRPLSLSCVRRERPLSLTLR